jgi:hypothetical protein
MKINSTRLQHHFEAMSLIGKMGETGTNRRHILLKKRKLLSWLLYGCMKLA